MSPPPQRIFFCGDPHGRFTHIVRAVREYRPSAVVLLGDLQPQQLLHKELEPILDLIWFIHGNHDCDSEADFSNVFDSDLAARNLHGRVVILPDGTPIAGLGGVFRESVWYPSMPGEPKFRSRDEHTRSTPPEKRWRDGPPRRHWGSIYPDEVDRLSGLMADVLVTHEAGACHPNGFEILDTLAQSLGVAVTFHGHHHDRLDYTSRWGTQGFRSHGVGLGGITDQSGAVIVPGELDGVRQYRQRRVEQD